MILSALEKCATSFWHLQFLMRNLNWCSIIDHMSLTAAFRALSLLLISIWSVLMCLGIDFWVYPIWFPLASLMCSFIIIIFCQIFNFLTIISLHAFQVHSLSFASGIPIIGKFALLLLSYSSLRLLFFFVEIF